MVKYLISTELPNISNDSMCVFICCTSTADKKLNYVNRSIFSVHHSKHIYVNIF